jgi:hypothetical protein
METTTSTLSPPARAGAQPARLTDAQRDSLLELFHRDGYMILPEKLPQSWMDGAIAAIDRIAQAERGDEIRSVKRQNCVALDPALRRLMVYEPALQLTYDLFGPMFHLNQANFISRPNDGDKTSMVSSIDWHADGPRPGLFPRVPSTHGPAMGLHYLKFGYFLTDLTHGTGGSLQVVRGSHRRDELDGKKQGVDFDIADYAEDVVQFDCEAGTVVAFHQAQWHAAPPNHSEIERKNLYISYCPTWMRPLDREYPTEADLTGLTAEERWLLSEPREPLRWWLPRGDDAQRMGRFARDAAK